MKKFGLLGRKLGHSFSPQIHQQIDGNPYVLIEVEPRNLARFLQNKRFSGINVTIPYKKEVMKYLDVQDASCRRAKACNTIVNRNGFLIGSNTDITGIEDTLDELGVSLEGKKVLILGNGGAMEAFRAVAEGRNASEIVIVYYKPTDSTVLPEEAARLHPDASFIFNATPSGMEPNRDESPIDLNGFENLELVFDAVYNPMETRLLQQARDLGIPSVNGLTMLVQQARKAHELFTGYPVDRELMHEIRQNLMMDQCGIVLVGMPSSGKTTAARILSEHLGKEWFDVDRLIEEQTGKTIARIFEEEGEAGFRKKEREMIRTLSSRHGAIISTGGGSILNPDNMLDLQQNNVILWLDRPLDLLVSEDPARPLLKQGLANLYQQRKDLYSRWSDARIENDQGIKNLISSVLKTLEERKTWSRFLPGSEKEV